MIHRDIKPTNIFVTPNGLTKIMDFGIARLESSELTHAGEFLGTPAYMSPEQALGEQVDQRTDIFSLGILIFEMLTGRPPFTAATATELTLQIVQAAAPVPSAVNRSLPSDFDPIVARALAKSLEQRYESAVTLAAELRSVGAILDVRSDIQEAASVFVPSRPARRSGAGWIILLLVLAVLGAAAWYERAAILELLIPR